jgi:hypothetical protein
MGADELSTLPICGRGYEARRDRQSRDFSGLEVGTAVKSPDPYISPDQITQETMTSSSSPSHKAPNLIPEREPLL